MDRVAAMTPALPHLIARTPRKRPNHLEPYAPAAVPRCTATATRPPRVAESWGCPGEPDEKQAFASGPAATSLLHRGLRGQARGGGGGGHREGHQPRGAIPSCTFANTI